MYQRPETPRSIGGTLDDGFRLFKACFSQVFILAYIAAVIGQIPSVMMSGGVTADSPFPQFTVGLVVSFVLATLAAALLYGTIIAKIESISNNQPLSMSQAFAVGLQRFFPLLLCGFLYSIAVVLGTLALIIPGIILSLTLLFGVYAVVVDNMGPVAALKYSHSLVWGNWWRTATIVGVATFVLLVGMLLVGGISGFALAAGGSVDLESIDTNPILNFVVLPLISALLSPLFYTFAMAAYNDLKLRRSGADLAERIGAQA
jgi:hypothetical protein